MDELARQLDQPVCHGNQDMPSTQYWLHLAEEFKVSREVVIRCQHNPENSPSKNMLEFQEGRDPYFSVQMFKDALRDIARNDLVKMLEQCSLPGEFSYFPSDNCAYFKKCFPLHDTIIYCYFLLIIFSAYHIPFVQRDYVIYETSIKMFS